MNGIKEKEIKQLEKPILGFYMVLPDPAVIEIAASAGYDFVRIDMEHHTFSYDKLGDLLRVARLCGLRTEVRISSPTDITKILDMGANGIVCPNVDNIRVAQEVITYTKYAPLGARGMYSLMPENRFGMESFAPYLATANDNITVTLQSESLTAIQNLDEILALEGVDMIATGRGELSQSMGLTGQTLHPSVIEAENMIAKKAIAAGKTPAILVPNKERAQQLWQLGVRVMLVGHDLDLLSKAMNAKYKDFISWV